MPFRDTAAYLDMRYAGAFYGQTTKTPDPIARARAAAADFGHQLFDHARP